MAYSSLGSAHSGAGFGADSDSDSSSTIPRPPAHVRGVSSSSTLSRLMVPGEMPTPINSVLTAEGIIMGGDSRGYMYGTTCGDCAACYDTPFGDEVDEVPVDAAVVRQFEVAFATFLYKNPAFTSMSHTTLQKLRAKLLRESAKNMKVEAELRRQLADMRDAKRNRELELQRELVVVTRAKAAREAGLIVQIQKTRRSSMMLDQNLKENGDSSPTTATPDSPPGSPGGISSWLFGFGSGDSSQSPANTATGSAPAINASESFEEFRKEIGRNKMEQAHILAEMEKIKMQIALESVNGTP